MNEPDPCLVAESDRRSENRFAAIPVRHTAFGGLSDAEQMSRIWDLPPRDPLQPGESLVDVMNAIWKKA